MANPKPREVRMSARTRTKSAPLDRAGRRIRANLRAPRPAAPNKGRRFPPDPPSPDEIMRVVDLLDPKREYRTRAIELLSTEWQDLRLAALIAVLWRGGLSLSEALALQPEDLDPFEQHVMVRGHRRGSANRKALIDAWGFERVKRWQVARKSLPPGPLFCVIRGPTAGLNWAEAGARAEVRRLGERAGIKNFTSKQLRYAHAIELFNQGVSPAEVYRQLGLDLARNNRVLAVTSLVNGSAVDPKPPTAKNALKRGKSAPAGRAYAAVRQAAQAADDAVPQARTRAAKQAWREAIEALHIAEDKIMQASAEDYGVPG